MKLILFFTFFIFSISINAQTHILSGKIINGKQDPLAFVSIRVKELKTGTITKEDGSYTFELEEGKYDLIITMTGYKTQIVTIIIEKTDIQQNIILEIADASNLSEVVVKAKNKDKAALYIRNVVEHKDVLEKASGAYSCKVYIKALQQDSMQVVKNKKVNDSILLQRKTIAELNRMAMAEIILQLDHGINDKSIKEELTGISKIGNTSNLFFLSTTDGDFNFYNNLVKIPKVSQTVFLSPFSYSGLLAYKFKTIKTEIVNGTKIYTISIKPKQLSNATVEGEVTIMDSLWVILHTKFSLPKYHLPEYDFFEVEQKYTQINNAAWMISYQKFTYYAASGKNKTSGETVATYNNFELNKKFDRKHFGTELSAASAEAYERDSSFWQSNRTIPLTEKEVRFINYKDSMYRVTHTEAYLDSIDKQINKITLKNIFIRGQNFNDHKKRKYWYIPALPSIYQPFQFGGTRLQTMFFFAKTYKSRKNINVSSNVSYGIRNKDVNGYIQFRKMYNPFNRGSYSLKVEKNFANIFLGDAFINLIRRDNIFLNKGIGVGHSLEIVNGLFLFSNLDMAFRRSVSFYKTNPKTDSIFGDILRNNRAIPFEPYNALYGKLQLEYTPGQRYIREPKEKIILGSDWPTFYLQWNKGISGVFNSKVNFDYLEIGLKQTKQLGTLGTSSYTIKTGKFINTNELRLIDYKRQRRGDTIFFLNPNEQFQSLDSSFPVFKQFYEGHYVHEFNGALLNKIPFLKALKLREIAGAGFLYAPERNNLKYGEIFVGIERIFKNPLNQLGKFKLGTYVSASAANQFKNPIQFKIGFTSWDKRNGKWQ
jgi:Family of unknown function (DUF5686)/CarboxypepD_reg-like domain